MGGDGVGNWVGPKDWEWAGQRRLKWRGGCDVFFFFFIIFFHYLMPTENAEDPCRSEGCLKTHLTETFPTPTLRSELAPRGSPSACAEKLLKIDPNLQVDALLLE